MPEHPASAAPAAPSLPVWLPPVDVPARRVAAGRWWDAVRVAEAVGAAALEALAGRSGPVVGDRRDGVYAWFVRPGAADGWRECLPVEVYGVACRLLVPSLGAGHGRWVEWVVRPEPGWDALTDARELRDALTATARQAVGGPRPEPGR
ncbi:hypothetical protein ACTWP5_18070 [Streptomyces sp. 4N509B]|uniref:hypothetical protein n=1 Tax=Streptomyces sp. 4N509B TaxID=3457413 RepID=UPI003FD39E49